MKSDNYLDVFDSKEKAIDHCIWLNFKYRIAKIKFGVLPHPKRMWAVCEEATANEMGISFLENIPTDYADMGYDAIRQLRMDGNPLPHLEEISGMLSTMDGEILRFILLSKIPIEKLIRFELGGRGYDENHRWVGFSKSFEIWLQ